jgi:DNA-binding response OmpR family regulator
MKILIIDDNTSITDMLSKYLIIKGFDVTVANSGRNGLNMIQNSQYDKILLDISMPEFSGLDVITELEKQGKLNKVNIILFTASSISNETVSELLGKEGIRTCLKKPVKLNELVQTLTT